MEKLFHEYVTYLKEAIKQQDNVLISEVRNQISILLDCENCKRIVQSNPSVLGTTQTGKTE